MMYQFNGWIDLIDDPEDPDDAVISSVAAEVASMIRGFNWGNAGGEIRTYNGSSVLTLAGAGNRPGSYPADVLAILKYLATCAPGSFGLVHWRDDEHPDPAARNLYHVIALRRGAIVETTEDLLSPIVPTIEP